MTSARPGSAVYRMVLVIMNGNKSKADTIEWLNTFQERVNIITGYEGLVFTVSIWSDKEFDNIQLMKGSERSFAHDICS